MAIPATLWSRTASPGEGPPSGQRPVEQQPIFGARGRGRPPGIDPQRRAALTAMVRRGLSLGEMAAALGVTRQCVHAQLSKCSDLHAEQLVRHDLRVHRERSQRRLTSGLAWIERHAPGGKALKRFLREAQAHGWATHAAPRRRPRINGARLAFHLPRRLRNTTPGRRGSTRYYHVQVTRPDWLHVVCLPTGRYVFYLPDLTRRPGSYYIPERAAGEPQVWPEWPPSSVSKGRRAANVPAPAWAA